MCFGSKDKGNDAAPKPAQIPHQPATSSVPPSKTKMSSDFSPPPGPPQGQQIDIDFAPPPGPPPGKQSKSDFAPPLGPPPGRQDDGDFAPPPGPPPSHDLAPPTGPPPSYDQNKHPDPSPGYFTSHDKSENNATEEEAIKGEKFCRTSPLYPPMRPDQATLDAVRWGNIGLFTNKSYKGTLERKGLGLWEGSTKMGQGDTRMMSYPPLYVAAAHSPWVTGRKKTIYYEVDISEKSENAKEKNESNKEKCDQVILALGFAARPYPDARLPGWHRASLGVHGDDGRKYINDMWGGKDFTESFKKGQTVGLGMEFTPGKDVEIFFTRDGREDGRWDLHEEIDQQRDRPVDGLEGSLDLNACIGVCDGVEFQIKFSPNQWKWKGYKG